MDEIQVIGTGFGPRSICFRLSQDASVDCLYDAVIQSEKLLSSDICIAHGVRRLVHGNQLRDYDIVDGSMLTIWQRTRGGCNLTELKGYITLTHDEDMITGDDDLHSYRAKMPCGHVIGSSTMTQYCQNELAQKKWEFLCPEPSCRAKWPFFLVRHVSCLSPPQLQEIEKKLGENFLQIAEGGKQCPGCKSWCVRIDKSIRVKCLYCEKHRKGQICLFCWNCTTPWTWDGSNACRSAICDKRPRTLKECSQKDIVGTQCPSVRACPRCFTLIEHTAYCKGMQCAGCKEYFCFICLTLLKQKGAYTCGGPYQACKVAPRQEHLF